MDKKKHLTATIVALAMTTISMAQNENKNPWGLVYDGALSGNVAGAVELHPVGYDIDGIRVSANLYLPAGFDAGKKYAAVVVSHPNGGVKEQVSGMFAQKLAEAGFVALACDARYQGMSGGQPRGTDRPELRMGDVFGMVDYISRLPYVDAGRIGAFGICGGGGYTLGAAQSDKRINAVATLSMFNTGRVRRNGYCDSGLSTVRQRLGQAAEARSKEAETGVTVYPPKQKIPTEEELAALPFDLYREGIFYYGTSKYAHPNDGSQAPVSDLLYLMAWDATDRMALITQPLLMMVGEKADSRYMTDEAMEKATGTEDKQTVIIPGATHIKTYYIEDYVELERKTLVDFFNRTLK